MEKFIENITEAEKIIKTADHLIYITFPLIQDKKLLLKILQQIKTAVAKCINSILQYDYLYKRISLYTEPKRNFETFQRKCAPRADIIANEIKLIQELFFLSDKHKNSPMEFVRNEKVVILSENSEPITINLEKIKEFLIMSKNILTKTRNTITKN